MNAVERKRYSRHLLIPEVGISGQERLGNARVLCIGAGGLGSPVLAYLAAAGVGRIGIVDDDVVDASNLQRQIMYVEHDIGRLKVDAARERLLAANPHIAIDAYPIRFTAENARTLVSAYDFIVDGSDSFSTRYLVNDACVLEQKPNVFASIFRFHAQITVFGGAGRPCYRCLYPQAPPIGAVPSCAEGGVLGAIAGIAGMWQATEALKLILGIGRTLEGRLLLIDALATTHREVSIARDADCEICGDTPTRYDVAEEDREVIELRESDTNEISPGEFFATLESGVRLLDVREPHEAVLGIYPNSLHIPFSQLDARMSEIDLNERYLVACRLGQRSQFAFAHLRAAGVGGILHLQGGLLAVAALEEEMLLF